ncbi:MAG TPA: type II toxin-antitoxin system VapC family toxin [Nocardioides sp.]|nr:type II toxin-antitoxin system VapC family toxin [Nocardioides sp.]
MLILDTNVVSELMKPPAVRDPGVMTWFRSLSDQPYMTAVTLGELFSGAYRLDPGKRQHELLTLIEEAAAEMAGVMHFDSRAAEAFGRISAARRRTGRPTQPLDAQIAAIALVNESTLATRNVSDFDDLAVELINPWG